MESVQTDSAPTPGGHYAQAVVHGGVIYVSGQLPVNPADPQAAPGGIEAQAEQALRNVEAVLRSANSGLDRLLQVTVYITDIEHWPAFNEVYARVLGSHRPARAVVPVKHLHHEFLVEIQAIAACP